MASNFKILVHRNSHRLHLVMRGDFDGTSAHELIHTLRENYLGQDKVFLHTSRLSQVDPFGVETFAKNLSMLDIGRKNLVFTGDYAAQIAPEGSTFF